MGEGAGFRVKLGHGRSGGPASQAPTLLGTSGSCFLSGSQEPSNPSVDADVFNMGARRERVPGGGWFLSAPKGKSDIRGKERPGPDYARLRRQHEPRLPEDKEEGASQVLSHCEPSDPD